MGELKLRTNTHGCVPTRMGETVAPEPPISTPVTELPPPVLGTCWGTEELGWNERSRKKLRDVRQQSNGFENYEL